MFEVTLRLAVSKSVCLGIEHFLGLATRYYFLSVCCCLKFALLCGECHENIVLCYEIVYTWKSTNTLSTS
jgi:hypothetical protein